MKDHRSTVAIVFSSTQCNPNWYLMRGTVIGDSATHLFEEPSALEAAARLAADWFRRHFHTHSEATD